MKNQALFSSKDKSKNLKCCLLQFLFVALRVKTTYCRTPQKVTKQFQYFVQNLILSFGINIVFGIDTLGFCKLDANE